MEIVDDPEIMEHVPSGEVVLIPDDDPELAASNLAGGMRRVHKGHNLTFYHIRTNPGTMDLPQIESELTLEPHISGPS
jgi:hypothetical protein